jgi:hypothetical protein
MLIRLVQTTAGSIAEARAGFSEPPPLPECELWHCPRCGKAMRVVERFTTAQCYFAGFDSS